MSETETVNDNNTSSENSTESLVLGSIYNLTGGQAGLDVTSSLGARLAVDEVNRGGGLLGRELRLVIEDGETDLAVVGAKTAALLETEPTLTAVIGLSDTDQLMAAAPLVARSGRVFLTSGATSPRLPQQVPEHLFLACFGDNVQAAVMAEWSFDELGARSVSVLYNSTMSFSRLLREYFEARFSELGGEVRGSLPYTLDDLEEIAPGVEAADAIFVSASPDEAERAVLALRRAGLEAPILSGDGFDSDRLWTEHPELTNLYFATHTHLEPDHPNPAVRHFLEAFAAAHPEVEPDAFTALGYDAVGLIVAAIRKAGTASPDEVLRALASLEDYPGVTGRISYLDGSRIPTKSVTVLAIDRGRRRFVTELVPRRIPEP